MRLTALLLLLALAACQSGARPDAQAGPYVGGSVGLNAGGLRVY